MYMYKYMYVIPLTDITQGHCTSVITACKKENLHKVGVDNIARCFEFSLSFTSVQSRLS